MSGIRPIRSFRAVQSFPAPDLGSISAGRRSDTGTGCKFKRVSAIPKIGGCNGDRRFSVEQTSGAAEIVRQLPRDLLTARECEKSMTTGRESLRIRNIVKAASTRHYGQALSTN